MAITTLCACGQPLHYTHQRVYETVQDLVNRLGPTIPVTNLEQACTYAVPRHYIALHGLKGVDLSALAVQYGWDRLDVPA